MNDAGTRAGKVWVQAVCTIALVAVPILALATSVDEATSKYRDGHREEAMRDFGELAEAGAPAAQIVLGAALINGEDLPRDLARGVAWLKIASTAPNANDATRERARKILDDVEPRLSGADLIRADQHVADYRSREAEHMQRRQSIAMAQLYPQPSPPPSEYVQGCAMDPGIPGCADARRALGSSPRCGGEFGPVDREPSIVGPLVRLARPGFPTDRTGTWIVTYAAHVDSSGWICQVRVAKSSGMLGADRNALEAIRAWRLQPATRGGQPVEAAYSGVFTFKH